MSLKNDAIPSSAAFDVFQEALNADRETAIKQGAGIYAFTIKNGATTDSWHLDLKETGKVGKGVAPQGKKATVTLQLSDADFQKLIDGKANAQNMFMSGKLKIKGDVMKATKLGPIMDMAKKAPSAKL